MCVSAGAQSCIELRNFAEAVQWCDEGLKVHPTDKKLQELRAAADKHKVQSLMSSSDFKVEVLVPLKPKALFVLCASESSRERCQKEQDQRKKAAWRERSSSGCYKGKHPFPF